MTEGPIGSAAQAPKSVANMEEGCEHREVDERGQLVD